MNCEGFKHELHELYMDRLPESEVPALMAHAEGCTDCKELMDAAAELTCKEFIEFLNEYLEDQLATERRVVFDRHLSICADCVNYLDSYRKTMQQSVLALSDGAFLPRDLPHALVCAILEARER